MKTSKTSRLKIYCFYLPILVLTIALVCDYLFYFRMNIKHKRLAYAQQEFSKLTERNSFNLEEFLSLYGKPDSRTIDSLEYTAYDLSECTTTFPFFEILLTGSADHFKRIEEGFAILENGNVYHMSSSTDRGIFKRKSTFEEEQQWAAAFMKMKPPPYKEITVFVNEPMPIIVISDLTPDPYSHPSTHPNSLDVELDHDKGHGDGRATVNFIGKTMEVTPAGELRPVPDVQFFRMNDSMLLNESLHDPLPILTDEDGDFKGEISVFAARGYLASTLDPIIYQTGTAIVGATAKGFKTRRVNVRYKQPSTLIILERE